MSRAHPALSSTGVVAGALLVAVLAARAAWCAPRSAPRPRIAPTPHLVDLNAADAAEIGLLPEVGPSMAAAIVADRAVRGPFPDIDALARVRGVGALRLEAIRPHARADGGSIAASRDGR
ncbi:MAG: hypothetical protein RIS86_875 [Planctomycetota bacterium]|jgi:competence protein ComEA